MELPALFYGLYRDVRRRTSKIVTQLRKGADWMALVEAEGFLDTDTTPGFIVMEGPSSLLGGEPHFHAWLLWHQLWLKEKDLQSTIEETVFEQSLTRPWSTLGLVSAQNHPWFYFHRHRCRPFLRAVRQYWELFDSVGPRYTVGSRTPQDLWSLPNCIMHVLAHLGVPGETLREPLPPGGLAELIDRTEQHLH